ncbi:MAG: arsenate reductase (glutaredoxin) [Rhizobiales bacterium TMED94]|nr:arsenate reductase (glutaredoxin) [Rhodobiaceae bacterium]RPF87614.1 MAG: arsenate reductase (glutaredoxin) [Rhizobiales bacterium TMED94]|tara:strand:- start:1125 stop:1472 length:348 start_codon:yes stop_codon:yes gene_type:complete
MKVKIYHNPRCSKSRQTLEILNKKKLDIDIIEYLKSPLECSEISSLLKKLGYTARDLLRRGEDIYKNKKLSDKSLTDDFLIDIMSKNPILIERPIVVCNDKAVIGRPPEKVLDIL